MIGPETVRAHSNGDCGSSCRICDFEDAQEAAEGRVMIVALPWTKPPLTQNRSSRADNVYAKAARVRVAKEIAGAAIRTADLPRLAGANVTLHFRPATRHRRDADGTCATLKVCLDALVAEGVLTDDSWVEVPFSGHRIHEPDGSPAAMWLSIEPLGERP